MGRRSQRGIRRSSYRSKLRLRHSATQDSLVRRWDTPTSVLDVYGSLPLYSTPYLVSFTSFEDATGTTSIDIDTPLDIVEGDVLIMLVGASSSTLPDTNPFPEDGWIALASSTSGGSSPSFAVVAKTADGTEGGATYVYPKPNTVGRAAFIVIRNGSLSDYVVGTPFASSTGVTSYNLGSVTTSWPNWFVLDLAIANSSTGSFTTAKLPVSMEELIDDNTPLPHIEMGYAVWRSSGATGSGVYTRSASTRGAGVRIAISSIDNYAVGGTTYPDVVISGAKKTVANAWIVVSGSKKAVVAMSVIVSGTKKPLP